MMAAREEQAEKGRGFPVDPSLPRWFCQSCRHPLYIVGVDSYADRLFSEPSRSGLQASSIQGGGSMLASTRMDHSFVILPKQKNQAHGIPPRPHSGTTLSNTISGVSPTVRHATSETNLSVLGTNSAIDNQTGKSMDESFVVLPPAAASMYKMEYTMEGGGQQAPLSTESSIGAATMDNTGFHSSVTVLKRAFDIATSQTQVDQPLCLECMRVLCNKLEEEVDDVNRDIKAYEASLQRLEGESPGVLSESDFHKEKMKAEEEERRLEAAIKEIEKQYADVNLELEQLESESKRFKDLEERYWHEFNDFQFQLTTHQVEWDEINAAWGQACLLLHTVTQYFKPKFPCKIKILPMGSYPRIMDSNSNRYELFGPVNLFWSTRYDKAMTLFLACLKDFADFAHAKDRENNVPPDKCFSLPYKIDSDKVENLTITQSFNKQENWTKALKYMLCDLKWVLYWFIGNTSFQPPSAMVPSQAEMLTMNSKQLKSVHDSKIHLKSAAMG